MYKLLTAPGSAGMAPHAALEEIGAPYDMVLVDTKKGEHRTPEYLKLNPNGRVPTLVEDGQAMYEAAAILLHLADKHQEAGLAPKPGAPTRMLFCQWLMYLTNTVQEAYMQVYHADYFAEGDAGQANVKAMAEKRLERMWGNIDAGLAARGPYLAGESFSGADLYLHMLSRWSRNSPRPAWRWPHVAALVDRVKARPAVQRMMAQEGLEEPH
jgi:glutathione S-transferase